MLNIRWKGKRYLLVGSLAEGGPIATRAEYRFGRVSTAHLFENGHIKQFGQVVGSRDDITVLGECDNPPTHTAPAFGRILDAFFRTEPWR